jgi:hypothetical protein
MYIRKIMIFLNKEEQCSFVGVWVEEKVNITHYKKQIQYEKIINDAPQYFALFWRITRSNVMLSIGIYGRLPTFGWCF